MKKARIWCAKHKRWHSAHENFHCKFEACPTNNKTKCPNEFMYGKDETGANLR